MQVSLKEKVVFVTGGTGILGRAFVHAALRAGACVWFSYFRNKQEAESLKKAGARAVELDLANPSSTGDLKGKITEAHGRVDILVNNAATVCDRTVKNLSANEWDHVIEVDLSAVFRLTHNLLPLLYRSEAGKIHHEISDFQRIRMNTQ